MIRFLTHVIALLILLPILSFAGTSLDSSLAPMLKGVLPAVINIKAQIKVTDFNTLREMMKDHGANLDRSSRGAPVIPNSFVSIGSGVIVDAKKGYIITNAHVVADAQTIAITTSDGRHFTAKTIGIDKPSDIALLQIKAKDLIALPLANSNNLKVGDFVAAIGNPFGLSQTVTSGIVSALGRTTLGIESFENFIQTDAPINPGNSGGALINMQGELVGINTAILTPEQGSIGIGFAIPANMAKSIMEQLIEFGDVKRGILGIGVQDITPELANAFHSNTANQSAAVTQVLPDSPAASAGLQVGDIITAINGNPIKNASDVVNTVGFLRVESKINISVLRNNKPITASVTLSDPSKRKQLVEHQNPFLYGTTLKNFSLLSPIHGNVKGVLVVSVDPESKSWQADLRPGDVITSANQQKVSSIEDLKQVATKSNDALLLNILRGAGAVFLVINKET